MPDPKPGLGDDYRSALGRFVPLIVVGALCWVVIGILLWIFLT